MCGPFPGRGTRIGSLGTCFLRTQRSCSAKSLLTASGLKGGHNFWLGCVASDPSLGPCLDTVHQRGTCITASAVYTCWHMPHVYARASVITRPPKVDMCLTRARVRGGGEGPRTRDAWLPVGGRAPPPGIPGSASAGPGSARRWCLTPAGCRVSRDWGSPLAGPSGVWSARAQCLLRQPGTPERPDPGGAPANWGPRPCCPAPVWVGCRLQASWVG